MKLYYFHTLSKDTSIYTKIEAQYKVFHDYVQDKELKAFSGILAGSEEQKGYILHVDEKNKIWFFNNCNKLAQIYNWLIAFNKLYYKVYKYLIKNNYTHVFIRKNWHMDFFFMSFLSKLKKNEISILYEIPTFPYDFELNSNSLSTKLDYKYRNKMYKYVDRIITYSNDSIIFGIKTIKIINGIIIKDQKIIQENKDKKEGVINLIAVAGLSPWHGYDRLLRGLGEYYKTKNINLEVIFHLVGDGTVLDSYKDIIEYYRIQDKVILYGKRKKEELDDIYNLADIAVASLGLHRINIHLASTLKTREYAAKGLPIITSCVIDFIPLEFGFQLMIPADESNINIKKIIEFYDSIYCENTRESVHKKIRRLAEDKCDMKIVLRPIVDYINKKEYKCKKV